MNLPKTNTTPECTECGANHTNDAVLVCPECRDIALCAECREKLNPVVQELDVCSEDCALAAISRMRSKIEDLRKRNHEMLGALRTIENLEPVFENYPDDTGCAYAYTLGTAKGAAFSGRTWGEERN